ncbi:MAG TPA: hypothetical protein VJV05_11345 [Pyrinomonadaceae bacterium]|nr:hypothetical protein [Pyrinomonadaceae bacterium]
MRTPIVLVGGLIVLGTLLISDFGARVLSRGVDNSYIVYVYNVDDSAIVYVNDREVGRVAKLKSAQFHISGYLVVGSNRVRLVAENAAGNYSYGFDVVKDGEVIHTFRCGVGLSEDCSKEVKTGIVFDRTVTINYAPSAGNANATMNAVRGGPYRSSNTGGSWNANHNGSSNGSWTPDLAANSTSNSMANVAANIATVIPWRGGVPNLVPKVVTDQGKKPKFSISARYPQIPVEPTGDDFNYEAARLVKDEIASFKNGLSTAPDGPTKQLTIVYKTGLVDRRVISVIFTVTESSEEDHPIVFSQNLNFDLREQRSLELSDLFREDSNYLAPISDYCMRSLREKFGDSDLIRKAAGPSELNYLGWSIVRTGIEVEFYKAEVSGTTPAPPTVLVPFSILKPIVRTGGPISHLVK